MYVVYIIDRGIGDREWRKEEDKNEDKEGEGGERRTETERETDLDSYCVDLEPWVFTVIVILYDIDHITKFSVLLFPHL